MLSFMISQRLRDRLCYICIMIVINQRNVKHLFIYFYFFTLDAGLLARSQFPESPATGHLDTGFSWFPCA